MLNQIEVNGEQIIVGHNGALVASRSTPGLWYSVRKVNGVQCCDCPVGQHGRSCRHVRAVEALNAPKVEPVVSPLAHDQNELLHVERHVDPLFLNERPHQPRQSRSFEDVFGFSPTAA